jgi:hypothetical protein
MESQGVQLKRGEWSLPKKRHTKPTELHDSSSLQAGHPSMEKELREIGKE